MPPILKQPSAWVPIALSLAMLSYLLISLWISGVPTPEQNADEGVGAHLFQLWLLFEVFLITTFALKWLPRAPVPAFAVLLLQILLVIAGCAPVFILKL